MDVAILFASVIAGATPIILASIGETISEKSGIINLSLDGTILLSAMIGFAIPGSEPGFQDIIGALYGYEANGQTIIGFEVLESKETPGLGDKIFKDPDFQTNFTALKVELPAFLVSALSRLCILWAL